MTHDSLRSLARPARLRIFACQMYEGVLLFGVVFFAAYLFDTLTQSTDSNHLLAWRQLVLFVMIGLYFVSSWQLKQQTLPMKTWNIVIVDAQQRKSAFWRLLLRYVCAWILPLLGAFGIWLLARRLGWNSITMLVIFTPFLNFLSTFVDPQQLFLHERFSGTRLLSRKS